VKLTQLSLRVFQIKRHEQSYNFLWSNKNQYSSDVENTIWP